LKSDTQHTKSENLKLKPIRLVLLLQDLEFGGTQSYAIHLLKHLDQRVFSSELWVMRGGTDMVPIAVGAGIKIVWLTQSSRLFPCALIKLLLRLIRYRPQILYTLTVVPNIWGRLLGRIAGVPTMVSGYRSLIPKQHERYLWPLSRRIICNAQVLKKIMVRRFSVNPERIAVIPNGVDPQFFSPTTGQKAFGPTALFVGRLVREKDPLQLLEAFGRVLDVLPKADLEMVGNGPLKKNLQNMIRSRSLESRVKLLPGTADLRPLFSRAWVFVLPSIREASPNVIIEAMAAGLPVVATRVGGIPELVEDGRTGILVRPGDQQGLAEALVDLLKNDRQRREMGTRARQRILACHSLEVMVKQTQGVLLQAFENRSGQNRLISRERR